MSRYEAHITFDIKYATLVKEECDKYSDWKYSQFDGDPVFGDQVFCYMTKNLDTDYCGPYNSFYPQTKEDLLSKMMLLCGELKQRGILPLRAKIEEVEYDQRFIYS